MQINKNGYLTLFNNAGLHYAIADPQMVIFFILLSPIGIHE